MALHARQHPGDQRLNDEPLTPCAFTVVLDARQALFELHDQVFVAAQSILRVLQFQAELIDLGDEVAFIAACRPGGLVQASL